MTLQASFDKQANNFDRRVGIDDQDCEKIARTLADFYKKTSEVTWLEIGVGTGQIGACSLSKTDKYIGIDISEHMLDKFRTRIGENKRVELYQANGNNKWPIKSKSVSLSFSSRTIHLLNPAHVLGEIKRVHQKGFFIIGRIRRKNSDNVKDVMKKKMREILHSLGYKSRKGEENRKQLLDLLCDHGAKKFDPIIATSWTEEFSPSRSIKSWLNKDGLAGQEINQPIKEECMKILQHWALDRYGSMDYIEKVQQTYILEGVDLHLLH